MHSSPRDPPGPVKRYKRYFTVPITDAIYDSLEVIKWRLRLDKTEVMRRLFDYFLTLPAESQDKVLQSFEQVRAKEEEIIRKLAGRSRAIRKNSRKEKKLKVKALTKNAVPDRRLVAAITQSEKPVLPVRPVFKRSGLS